MDDRDNELTITALGVPPEQLFRDLESEELVLVLRPKSEGPFDFTPYFPQR
jgi:hypothetical protein